MEKLGVVLFYIALGPGMLLALLLSPLIRYGDGTGNESGLVDFFRWSIGFSIVIWIAIFIWIVVSIMS